MPKRTRVYRAFNNVEAADPDLIAAYEFMRKQNIQHSDECARAMVSAAKTCRRQKKRSMLAAVFDVTGRFLTLVFHPLGGGRDRETKALMQAAQFMPDDDKVKKLHQFLREQSGIAYRPKRSADDCPF
jgi:hypothetical protein